MEFTKNLLYKLFFFKKNYCDETDNVNAFVRFTDKCPNKCTFCFDQYCHTNNKNISGKKMAEVVNNFGRKHIMLSGGEPCINMKRLEEFIDNLDKDIIIESFMTSLPKTAYLNKDILYKVIERSNIIDISSHGTSNEEDENVYKIKLGYDKQAFISELAKKYPEKVFVSCVMCKSNKTFTTLEMLEKRIMWYYGQGVRNIYLNELGNSNKPFESEDEYVSINTILRNSGKRDLGGCFSNGCKVDISKYFKKQYPGILVKVRRRCYRTGGGEDYITWRDCLKVWINKHFVRKIGTPVIRETGDITEWFTNYEYNEEI